jgi:hypothetical protein
MAEQSSTVTSFRAFVMLICVLLIPLAAVCGTSFPSAVKAIQSGRLPTLADFRGPGENSKSGLSDAPPFIPGRMSNSPVGAAATGNFVGTPNAALSSTQPGMPNSASSGVVPVNYEAPIAAPPRQSTTFPQSQIAEKQDFLAVGNRGLSQPPAGLQNPISQQTGGTTGEAGDLSHPTAGTSQPPADGTSSPDATIKYIHDRLKQLGATYYLLEPWGDRMDAFRFYCKVAIGGNPHVTRSFENVDADPLKAMGTVLRQIEDWQKRG